MYADDLVLISRAEVGLQGLIDTLGNYCKRWKMEVDTDKTKIMKSFGNGRCKTTSFYRGEIDRKCYKLQISRAGIQCVWYMVKRYGQFIYKRFEGDFLFKRYICTGNIKAR